MKTNAAEKKWVETTLAALSLREKIGQILVPVLSHETADPLTVAGMVKKYCLGGGHYFGGGLTESVKFIGEVQAAAKIPLLITGDLDRGGGDRIKGGTLFPSQMALGAADDEKLAYRLGQAIAVENLAVGYNWTFSPIVDLCGIKDHLRHIAAIGRDPRMVGRLAAAQIKGIQDHGMAACAKHFPGDGFDDRDQHLTTSINPLAKKEWWRQSGHPFKKAIEAGVYSIMNSHIALPALDPDSGGPQCPRPSSLSPILIQDVLRKQLGFAGVIITDALNMGGVSMHAPIPERYMMAFEAGNDMLLFVRSIGETVTYFERCLDRGRITKERLDESVRRILTMKAAIGLHKPVSASQKQEQLKVFINSPFKKDAQEMAEKSITLIKDTKKLVPLVLPKGARIASVLITNRHVEFDAAVFDTTLRAAGHMVTSIVNPDSETMYDRVAAKEFDVVITSLFFPIQWGWATPRCHGPSIRSIMCGFHRAHPDVKPVFVSFDSPYRIYEFAFMDPFLVTYGSAPVSQEAAAKALLGQIPIKGKVPVELEGFFKIGDGIDRKAHKS